MDPESEEVANRFNEARGVLAEADHIFNTETTSTHRDQWPNVHRLEGATTYAQEVLSLADPRINQPPVANEMLAAATQGRDAIRAAVDSGGGNLIESANRLLGATSAIVLGPVPSDVEHLAEIRREIENARGKIESEIGEAATEIAGQKDQALTSIGEAVVAVGAHREAADQQASELGIVTSAISAENLADAYAKDAKRTEQHAKWYTWASIGTGLLSIVVAGLGVYSAGSSSELHIYISRAALGIPVALFAAYINNLASTHRREAWRLRHIDLQIRTANPFLGLLASGPREEALAALALRFFPGQEGVGFDGEGAANSNPELVELLRQLIQQQGLFRGNVSSAPSPPPASPSAQ